MYMHRYGGLYFDLDFFCLRPLAPAVANLSGVVLGYMVRPLPWPECGLWP